MNVAACSSNGATYGSCFCLQRRAHPSHDSGVATKYDDATMQYYVVASLYSGVATCRDSEALLFQFAAAWKSGVAKWLQGAATRRPIATSNRCIAASRRRRVATHHPVATFFLFRQRLTSSVKPLEGDVAARRQLGASLEPPAKSFTLWDATAWRSNAATFWRNAATWIHVATFVFGDGTVWFRGTVRGDDVAPPDGSDAW